MNQPDDTIRDAPAAKRSDQMQQAKLTMLTKIRTFSYRYEAEMAKELLQGEGIEVLISSDDHGAVIPFLAFADGVDLLVKEEDITQATEMLDTAFGTS